MDSVHEVYKQAVEYLENIDKNKKSIEKSGYYWAKFKGSTEFEITEYSSSDSSFRRIGDDEYYSTDDLIEINTKMVVMEF